MLFPDECEQIVINLILMRGRDAVRGARVIDLLRALDRRADFSAESFAGTIWSSSPRKTNVGTSNFLRSSVKSVSENASMLS